MAVVTMKNLLESGVHFGHQTKRWDPRMKKYIFAERNGIHIIDLQKTITSIKAAYEVVRKTVLSGKSVLFVGTKKQAQAAVERDASRCGMFYVNNRWLGGMLTNFSTIKKSLLRLKKIEKMEIDGTFESLTKKEVSRLVKEKSRMEKNLKGIKEMKEPPGIVFVIDTRKEAIAVAEARRLNIPIIAVVDTNCNPEGIDFPIPGNDDAIRAITLFTQIIANAVVEAENEVGLEVIETLQEEDKDEADLATIISKTAIKDKDSEEEEEDLVKAPLAVAIGKADDTQDSFTDKDYSNFSGEDVKANQNEINLEQAPAKSTEIDKNEVDEDKLYEE
ncbi:MAG: 30S ribosomal protein S2 [Spirochaetales bacterium]|nr:30S ribosomal protein S2 [Spirochaetales bacterium]